MESLVGKTALVPHTIMEKNITTNPDITKGEAGIIVAMWKSVPRVYLVTVFVSL